MKRASHRLLLAAALTFALPAFAAPDPNFHVFLCFGQGSNFGDKQKLTWGGQASAEVLADHRYDYP